MTILVETDGKAFNYTAFDPPISSEWRQALLSGHVVDEITGRSPAGPIRVEAITPHVNGKADPNGILGLVGRPLASFGPNLPPTLSLRIVATGYVPRIVEAPIGAQPAYPSHFETVEVGEIALVRTPTPIAGRAVRRTASLTQPTPGASVAVTGYWATFEDVAANAPANAAEIVFVDPPLRFDRTAAAAAVRSEQITLANPPKTLVNAVSAGAGQIRVSDTAGLAMGDVIAVNPAEPGRMELIEVTQISPALAPSERASLTLAHPLAWAHPADAEVRRVSLAAPGPANAFDRDASADESCLFLDGTNGMTDEMVVSISGGAPTEYRTARLARAVADAAGDFRLPPLSRIAVAELTATAVGLTDVSVAVAPRYRQTENRIEVTFT